MRSLVQIRDGPGGIAQLVERCFCKANVSGSNPLISKTKKVSEIQINLALIEDTLVFRSEEGRGYQRYTSGNWTQVMIRRIPNKETLQTTY